jgi:hypothetical protein
MIIGPMIIREAAEANIDFRASSQAQQLQQDREDFGGMDRHRNTP